MDYKRWVGGELKELSRSYGFRFTPREETERRLTRLRTEMKRKEIESLLVVEKMDLYYLSGTTQDGFMFVPVDGIPILMIKRELERARVESPLENVVGMKSIRDIPSLIRTCGDRSPTVLGLELDVLPARDYFRLQEIFFETRLVDAAPLLRNIRKLKSTYEISLMKVAGEIGRIVYEKVKDVLNEGMTEIELGGLLEAIAKKHGHEGLLRVRSLNYEAYSWHVLSGWTGGIVSQSDSPMGGLGLSPAFPVGASFKVIKPHEPILVDFGICYHGYQVDQTRMFSIGKMEKKYVDAYRACREIHDAVLEDARSGADCEGLFLKTVRLAKRMGYEESYLGPPGLQTRFVGHGIGLELNEPPFLAQGHSYPLEEGMTFAIEPKIVFPGEGAAGFENTVVVTKDGCEVLTPTEAEIVEV